MNPVLIALVLLLTIALAMALGIVLGYALFSAILHAFGQRTQSVPAPRLGQAVSGGN